MSKKHKVKSAREFIEHLQHFDSFRKQLIFKAEDRIFKDDVLALIFVYSILELILNFLVKDLFKHGVKLMNSRPSFTTKAILLNEVGVIDDELLNNLLQIKKLRHSVAHKIIDNIEWQGKFTFDKNDLNYKKFVEDAGEPIGLVNHLLCIWIKLYNMGKGAIVKRML